MKQRGGTGAAGNLVAFLAALLLFVVAHAALSPAQAHGAAHGRHSAQVESAAAIGAPADCLPHHPVGQAAQHAACCAMAGCGASVAALPRDHCLPERASGKAAFAPAVATAPKGTGAPPLTPPPRHAA